MDPGGVVGAADAKGGRYDGKCKNRSALPSGAHTPRALEKRESAASGSSIPPRGEWKQIPSLAKTTRGAPRTSC